MNTQDSRCLTATPSDRLPLLSLYTDRLTMIIPPNMLEEATLKSLVEEFVTRDGTDNGDDSSLQQRVNAVMNQLALKQVLIVYDDITETANIVPADTVAMA
ncbi:YheU family protein [Kistimonas scapharcae]